MFGSFLYLLNILSLNQWRIFPYNLLGFGEDDLEFPRLHTELPLLDSIGLTRVDQWVFLTNLDKQEVLDTTERER